jgi:hypothetical protein
MSPDEPPWAPLDLFRAPFRGRWPLKRIFTWGPPADEVVDELFTLVLDGDLSWVCIPLWSLKDPRKIEV